MQAHVRLSSVSTILDDAQSPRTGFARSARLGVGLPVEIMNANRTEGEQNAYGNRGFFAQA